jgi:hypothetical protein
MSQRVAEAKEVRFRLLEAGIASSGASIILVEGLIFHGSLTVEIILLERIDHELEIRIFLTLARKGLSCRFALKNPLENIFKKCFSLSRARYGPRVRGFSILFFLTRVQTDVDNPQVRCGQTTPALF